EAGPASGFGLWIRVKLDDGTTHVYGHIQSYSVSAGQRIEAGDVIAKMGARGQSTGPHLHFEVWDSGGKKIDPLPWLSERGVDLCVSRHHRTAAAPAAVLRRVPSRTKYATATCQTPHRRVDLADAPRHHSHR